ncbi:ABC transporter substrate-binding protein [Gracilibacillus salinarum]|uniref:Extracellular solute-binding protein n=1 Tax=Gracilibacillus salinarum TaxID=2932255 RepID=A0ABY4GT22_9BACI|nr:extracellular solute-binding protein [Gracilibacillus salinarum]UOQ86377.1 extracellular solute-binding protein [Gracilibacillus salinarum]
MKKVGKKIIFILLLLLCGCSNADFTSFQSSPLAPELLIQEEVQGEQQRLEVWTNTNIFSESLPGFLESHQGVEVTIKVFDKDELLDKYRRSLIAGESPDVFVIPDNFLGEFSDITGFENLLNEPYYDEDFFAERPSSLLKRYQDEKKQTMFAMPLLFFPYVTFYRADILREYGYPTDPYQLAIFLKERSNWMEMAQELAQDGRYILESEHKLIEMLLRTNYFLDDQYHYLAAEPPFSTAFVAASSAAGFELSPYLNIWDSNGQTALKANQLVMFQAASYTLENLKEWVPDQAGKWGMTSLPFDVAGIDNNASMSIAISETSKQKELAWAFIQKMSDDMLHMYKNVEHDSYLLNQDLEQLYWMVLHKELPGKPHSLDQQIFFYWNAALKNFNDGKAITYETIDQVNQQILNAIKYDQRALHNYLTNTE